MQLYLIRHTKVAVAPGICYGQSDVPLAEGWENVARDIARQLEHLKEPVVYTSPLSRCRLLAEKLSPGFKEDDRLLELNFGAWELKAWNNIIGPCAEQWMNDFVNTRCPGGESYSDLSKRVQSFLADLMHSSLKESIVVSHGGVIRTMLALSGNIPLNKSFEIDVPHGQIILLTI
jgi:alpha-ribazole phosphatase